MTGIPEIAPYRLPSADELPANTARWRLDPSRAVLLVHDMQRYFLAPFPADPRRALVDRAALLRTWCAARGMPVAYTAQPGSMTRRERGLLGDFWGPGMRAAPEDREVVAALAPAAGDWLLVKRRYSAFFRSGLLARLREAGRDQLVLCGVYAHVGVLATAVEAFSHDIRVFLVADAVADFSREHHDAALRYAAERCAVVVTTEEVLS
ncbi:isochorismatase family protein [Streptomyces showdoensis]|uniref:Isochorismatase n=1 Tax=Streptomyces showdoensis TaxID=68268 RepID=A0A2P2GCN5_STREW|nr:isochorismatase family protein [Streptomyces showdoensis]KKZ69237.1 isochorismatase [Streptomyces showdoensis]